MAETFNDTVQVLKNDVFIYPKDQELNVDELKWLINRNEQIANDKYDKLMAYYVGRHDILDKPNKVSGVAPKLVNNMPRYLVNTYNGFFTGIPPKITLPNASENETLQDWNNTNSIFDKTSELSKQVDIFGRSLFYVYQDEEGNTCVTVSSPTHSFMIYDDTVSHKPLAFVRYYRTSKSELKATIWYAHHVVDLINDSLIDHVFDDNEAKDGVNIYGQVPAVEFYETEERESLYGGGILTLVDALDDTLSQKLDNINYLADSYMYLLGGRVDNDEIKLMRLNRFIQVDGTDAVNMKIGFLERPDGDNIQEHMIEHLNQTIHEDTGIPDMKDEAFSGNSSGVAIRYKLMPMENRAMTKERKFTQALRKLYKIVFSPFTKVLDNPDAWQDLSFKFTRNIPANVADEVSTAKNAEGIVSHKTQLSMISTVTDPQAELEEVAKEKTEAIKQAQNAIGANPDLVNEDETDEEED